MDGGNLTMLMSNAKEMASERSQYQSSSGRALGRRRPNFWDSKVESQHGDKKFEIPGRRGRRHSAIDIFEGKIIK